MNNVVSPNKAVITYIAATSVAIAGKVKTCHHHLQVACTHVSSSSVDVNQWNYKDENVMIASWLQNHKNYIPSKICT